MNRQKSNKFEWLRVATGRKLSYYEMILANVSPSNTLFARKSRESSILGFVRILKAGDELHYDASGCLVRAIRKGTELEYNPYGANWLRGRKVDAEKAGV